MKIWNTLVCVCIGVIRGAVLGNAGDMLLTSSPPTATDGEPVTLMCIIPDGSVPNVVWLQNNTLKVVTQNSENCIKRKPLMGNSNISPFSESCNDTVHRIEFMYNSTRDQGEWQCGKYENTIYISPISNIHSIGVASPVLSNQSSPSTTWYAETTSEPGTETPQKASTNDSDTIYIVVGVVVGAVLLAVGVVGIVCIRQRRQAAYQKEDMKGKNADALPVYQNTSCHTVENELYRSSCNMTPVNEAEHEKDDFIMSDLYAEVRKPKKKRQDGPNMSEDVNTGDVYAKPNKR